MEEKWTANRIICAVSGPIGRFLANVTDKALTAAGYDQKVVELGRKAAGHGGAFILTAMGAPEAALAIASSAGATESSNPEEEAKVNPHVADNIKGKTINANVKG